MLEVYLELTPIHEPKIYIVVVLYIETSHKRDS